MRLALRTDFALRTLLYLATQPGRAHVADIAQFFCISKDHVAKAVNQLARQGFLRSIRGVGGGIELARPAAEISLGQVIRALEGNLHLLECVGTDHVCVIQPACSLRQVLAEAERLQSDYLDRIKLSDVVRPEAGLVALTASAGVN